MKRKDEEFSKLRFNEYISKLYPSGTIEWEEVSQKEEPPDFYLHLDGTKYAVEVTEIVEQIDVGTARTISVDALVSFLWAFVGRIEREAKNKGFLSGAYIVHIFEPIKQFREVEGFLFQEILTYIQDTQSDKTAKEKEIAVGYVGVCSVEKIHNTKDIVYPGGPALAKFEGQAARESQTLLGERLKDKVDKLKSIKLPIILLILDMYRYFPNKKAFLKYIPFLPELSRFHTVFIVSPDFDDFLFYSENNNGSNEGKY